MNKENWEIREYNQGDFIIKKGEKSRNIYFIEEGEAEVVKYDEEGNEIVISKIQEGEVFGELGVFEGRKRKTSIRAFQNIKVRIINPVVFEEIYNLENSKELIIIIKSMINKIKEYGNRLAENENNFEEEKRTARYKVIFKPNSRKAKKSFVDNKEVVVDKFPFQVGRIVRRKADRLFTTNDFYLYDKHPYNISRNHFEIIETEQGIFFKDVSKLGSYVNKVHVKKRDRLVPLNLGINKIILGAKKDRLKYQIIVEEV